LLAAGVPAAPVIDARDIAFHAQLHARAFFESVDHPVVGRHDIPGIPFRFGSRLYEPWFRTPAPLLGQHNDVVLGGELGLSDADAYRQHFGTSHDQWDSTRGGGMVWAATAPYEAAKAIARGDATYVLNSFAVAWATERGSMTGGPGQAHAEEQFKQQLEVPFG